MEKIDWCLKQKNGIELVEPNEDLSKAYLKKVEDSLRASVALKGNRDWEISSAYYAQYFALYAILMKIGIKCEIHSCTITFMKKYLHGYFTQEEMEFISKSQKARNDMQYYSDKNISDKLYLKIIKNTPLFIVKCKHILNEINEREIKKIRGKLHGN